MTTSIAALLEGKGRALHAVQSTVTVTEAVQAMNRFRIGSILVMHGPQLAGIFTERDALTRVVAENLDPRTTPITQVMTKNVITISPETTVQEIMDLFAEKRCRHVPVMQDAELIGLISIGDVSRWVANSHRAEAESLRQYIAGALTT
ncbi:CBS domain-containing protein [Oleiharenicola lentus]|uniref:CBS domain-containing protein n=1 Tax=Oleiharenicola lentus TaxID=2508720 RepID=UPI003F66A171